MADRDEILAYAASLLDLDSFPDYGPMGLQVAGSHDVSRLACAVSASLELFERVAELGADFLVVHHGLLWDNESRVIDDRVRRRLQALFDADVTLGAYHLALDAHPEVGNNALLATALGLEEAAPFAQIGVGGTLREAVTADELVRRVARVVEREPLVFAEGQRPIRRVAVVSGGGARFVADAAVQGYDAFVTGEAAEPTLHLARELAIHFVAAGHYATERLGVQALTERLAERFGLPWHFVELPNPV